MNAIATRVCSRCKERKALTLENFYFRPDRSSMPSQRWTYMCRPCQRDYDRARHIAKGLVPRRRRTEPRASSRRTLGAPPPIVLPAKKSTNGGVPGQRVASVPRLLDRLRAATAVDLAFIEGCEGAVPERPQTRAQCAVGERPCPWFGCRDHLMTDVTEQGGLRITRPDILRLRPDGTIDIDVERLATVATCARDIEEPQTLDAVGRLINVTRERAAQIEDIAIRKVRRAGGER